MPSTSLENGAMFVTVGPHMQDQLSTYSQTAVTEEEAIEIAKTILNNCQLKDPTIYILKVVKAVRYRKPIVDVIEID